MAVEAAVVETSTVATILADQARSENALGKPVSCRKGCANCCHQPVMISLLEGIRIANSLMEQSRWTAQLRAKLEAIDTSADLLVRILAAAPCVFLTADKTCDIYSSRPFACRIAASKDDPAKCHPHQLAGNGMLPRAELFAKLEKAEAAALAGQIRGRSPRMPLRHGILLGAALIEGTTTLSEAVATAWMGFDL